MTQKNRQVDSTRRFPDEWWLWLDERYLPSWTCRSAGASLACTVSNISS